MQKKRAVVTKPLGREACSSGPVACGSGRALYPCPAWFKLGWTGCVCVCAVRPRPACAGHSNPCISTVSSCSMRCQLWLMLMACLALLSVSPVSQAHPSNSHTSNWAVLVSTSRHWLNYRHSANVMSMYRILKRFGLSDSNIILMASDDHACNPRNPFKAQVFGNESHQVNVYGDDVEVDYRGYEVTVENFLRVLTGRHDPGVPRTKRLLSDAGSNVLIYITGHGGDEFIKFSDTSELMAQDLADAMEQMAEKRRYNQVLLMVDSCEAHTQISRIRAPRVIALGSSIKGESAFAYKNDYVLGQAVVDRFTHLTLHWASQLDKNSNATLHHMLQIYSYDMMESHLGVHVTQGWDRTLDQIHATEFLGSVASTQLLNKAYPVKRRPRGPQSAQEHTH